MYIDMVVDSVLRNIIYGGILAIVVYIIPKGYEAYLYNSSIYTYKYNLAIAMMYFTGLQSILFPSRISPG